ncbi:hypothetical protein QTP88_001443 [Uroleucon formosanum]
MCQFASEEAIDFIFVSEYNNLGNQHWYPDKNRKAAIVCNPNNAISNTGQSENGFRWIEAEGLTLYSCYWSPNTLLQEYEQFLSRLESDVRQKATEIIIAGDFNAWHTAWGARSNNARGEALVDMISSLGLVICNKGSHPTFQQGNRESIVDLTMASQSLSTRINNWQVLDVVSLSDHNYIRFDTQIHTQGIADLQAGTRSFKINHRKLEETLETGDLINVDLHNAEECATAFATKLRLTCGDETNKGIGKRKSVYWWTPALSNLRKIANHARRKYQRKKRRLGLGECTAELNEAKKSKLELTKAIKNSKELCWKQLCNLVEHDPWDNRVREFLESDTQSGLSENQFGFRSQRSTMDALAVMCKAADECGPSGKVGMLSLDVQNAFNSAPWDKILDAMEVKELPSYLSHAISACDKANKAAQNLARILPNVSAATQAKRKLMSNVVHSMLLYGAPVWANRMSKKGLSELAKVQRCIALRVATAYRTTSIDAVLVIAGIPPIDLQALKRKTIYEQRLSPETSKVKIEAENELNMAWQTRWDNEEAKGRWTHRLIRDISRWRNRRHGSTDYWLTQALTDHGCFGYYLHKIRKQDNTGCWYCDYHTDNALHTFFQCDAWETRRFRVETEIGGRLGPDNLMDYMLKDIHTWNTINGFIHGVLKKKTEEERRRQGIPP